MQEKSHKIQVSKPFLFIFFYEIELFQEVNNITIVKAKRSINSVSTKRGNIDEVVIRNYD